MPVTNYVCGFLFADAIIPTPRVLLIENRRPKWQAGRLNGIGGHIEPGETPLEAMNREFQEEAGLSGLKWTPVAVLNGATFQVHFFSSWTDRRTFDSAAAQTDEPLVMKNTAELWKLPVLPNLLVLIPLALDRSGIVKPVVLTDDRSAGCLARDSETAVDEPRTKPAHTCMCAQIRKQMMMLPTIEHGLVRVENTDSDGWGDDSHRDAHPHEVVPALVQIIVDLQERIEELEKWRERAR